MRLILNLGDILTDFACIKKIKTAFFFVRNPILPDVQKSISSPLVPLDLNWQYLPLLESLRKKRDFRYE
jgi:hypothetical protein